LEGRSNSALGLQLFIILSTIHLRVMLFHVSLFSYEHCWGSWSLEVGSPSVPRNSSRFLHVVVIALYLCPVTTIVIPWSCPPRHLTSCCYSCRLCILCCCCCHCRCCTGLCIGIVVVSGACSRHRPVFLLSSLCLVIVIVVSFYCCCFLFLRVLLSSSGLLLVIIVMVCLAVCGLTALLEICSCRNCTEVYRISSSCRIVLSCCLVIFLTSYYHIICLTTILV